MTQTESKVSSVSDSSSPDESLFIRLSTLRDKLKDISYNLVESNAAARAYAIVDTMLTLNSINYQAMNNVCTEMIQVDACNIFPTQKETKIPQASINEASELAQEILYDVPMDIVILPEKADEYYEFIGTIINMRRLLTKNNDDMAVLSVRVGDSDENEITIVAFPRTFDAYRLLLELRYEHQHPTLFICDIYDEETDQYILSSVDVPPAPVSDDTQPMPPYVDENDETLPDDYRAVFFSGEDLPWQAQWYSGTTYHDDGYERCSFYATPEEAIEGAKRAKANSEMISSLFENGTDDAS